MSALSSFFILNRRGDKIVARDYRHDVPREAADNFFRAVRFWQSEGHPERGTLGAAGSEAPPVFHLAGVNYFHLKANSLLFVAATRGNASPSFVLEFLSRVARIIKDYCGVLSEDSLRKNFVLVYELLDEVIDNGYAQNTSTQTLKEYVYNPPVAPPSIVARAGAAGAAASRVAPMAVQKSVLSGGGPAGKGKGREEIFVDVVERLSVTFNASGYVLTSQIDGNIQVKSFLNGTPELRVALNEDLAIGSRDNSPFAGDYGVGGGVGVMLDDCNFHESVKLDQFAHERVLSLSPPSGEFTMMSFRTSAEFQPPFRIIPSVEEVAPFKAEITLKIKADFRADAAAANVALKLPLPKCTVSASASLEVGSMGQSTEFSDATKTLLWTCKKFSGAKEHVLKVKLNLSQERLANLRKECGPINLMFTIPMHSCSKLQVRYLQVQHAGKPKNVHRWVRYVTTTASYVCRL
mmetsp:Transcript_12362/g.40674  ORF Transcript_12362/g.40674 Transcript_12362/m.40674 type:complete len:464 (+) Transcript_12362:28-1419(+)